MKKMIIFDLDGTLLNTIDDITDSLNFAIKDFNKTIDVETAKVIVGNGVDVLISRLIEINQIDVSKFDYVKNKYIEHYRKNQKNKTLPYRGFFDVLNVLKGNYYLVVLSNKPHVDTVNIVKFYFGESTFDCIHGQIPGVPTKPDPTSILHIIDKYKLKKEEVWYIGDTITDYNTAKNAGIDFIGAVWGFRGKKDFENHSTLITSPYQILDLAEKNL